MAGVTPATDVSVIGRFVPSELDAAAIERELRPLLPSCCQRGQLGVRLPQGLAPHPDNLQWHRDQGVQHIVLWASEDPTEVRTAEGVRVPTAPFDLVLIDNTRAEHRQPAGTNERTRWFAAVRCGGS